MKRTCVAGFTWGGENIVHEGLSRWHELISSLRKESGHEGLSRWH